MPRFWSLAVPILLCLVALGADQPQHLPELPCRQVAPTTPACNPSKEDLKKAESAFSKALKLTKEKRMDDAYQEFDTAARLVPRNLEYLTALAVARAGLVSEHLKRGNEDLEKGLQVEAQAEFRGALNLDPDNSFAEQRLQDSLGEWAPSASRNVQLVEYAPELHVVPSQEKHSFHFRGDSRQLLTQVAGSFGLVVHLDDSVPSRRVRFDVDDVNFYRAIVAKETPENRRLFERMAMRTFQVSSATTPQEMMELTNVLRTIFEIRFIQQQAQSGELIVRAPVGILDAATQFLENFGRARPQVMLDVKVYEIDHQLTRNLGVHIPNNFTLFNIPAGAIAALTTLAGGQNIQSLINSLIASGGINQANSTAISGLLAQLVGQQNSIFSQPVATFGGGLTLMGLTLDMLAVQLSLNESWVQLMDHATLRAGQGKDTTFRMGERYPVINASFAPIFNTPAVAQVLQNGSFQAPIPSFSYEDLGLDIKATPAIAPNFNVALTLEVQLRTLSGQSVNGVPIIANRQYKASISLLNGEPAIVASSLSRSEALSMTGIPGLGAIPGLNKILTTNSKTTDDDELMVVITPQVVNLDPTRSAEIWLPK
jgi:general secretion pathway protein D